MLCIEERAPIGFGMRAMPMQCCCCCCCVFNGLFSLNQPIVDVVFWSQHTRYISCMSKQTPQAVSPVCYYIICVLGEKSNAEFNKKIKETHTISVVIAIFFFFCITNDKQVHEASIFIWNLSRWEIWYDFLCEKCGHNLHFKMSWARAHSLIRWSYMHAMEFRSISSIKWERRKEKKNATNKFSL